MKLHVMLQMQTSEVNNNMPPPPKPASLLPPLLELLGAARVAELAVLVIT